MQSGANAGLVSLSHLALAWPVHLVISVLCCYDMRQLGMSSHARNLMHFGTKISHIYLSILLSRCFA